MKDWLIFTILGIIIGLLGGFLLMGKSTYVDPIVIKTTKWKKTLVDNPVPVYVPVPGEPAVPIPDTAQWGNIPVEPFRYEFGIPFAVNDSNYEMPTIIYGEAKWLKKLDVETPQVQFVYEVKLKKQIDWKWTFLAFAVGAMAMRGVDALMD